MVFLVAIQMVVIDFDSTNALQNSGDRGAQHVR
jgi:hypothetical protein